MTQEVENTKQFIGEIEPLKREYCVEKEIDLLKDFLKGEVNLTSFIDPEARCGYKDRRDRFLGIKRNIGRHRNRGYNRGRCI